jgi:uncharacterized OB-fold protein
MKPKWRERYDELKSKGLCTKCGREAIPGRVRCTACREYTRLWVQGNADKRVARGLCARCGKNPVSRYRHCIKCRRGQPRRKAASAAV